MTVNGTVLTYDQFVPADPEEPIGDFELTAIAQTNWNIGQLNTMLENRALQDQELLKDHIKSVALTGNIASLQTVGAAIIPVLQAGNNITFSRAVDEATGSVIITATDTKYMATPTIVDGDTMGGGSLSFSVNEAVIDANTGEKKAGNSVGEFTLRAGQGVKITRYGDSTAEISSTLVDNNTEYKLQVRDATEDEGNKGATVDLMPYDSNLQSAGSFNLVGDGDHVKVNQTNENGVTTITVSGEGSTAYSEGTNVNIASDGKISATDTTYRLSGGAPSDSSATIKLTGTPTGGPNPQTNIDGGSIAVTGSNGVAVSQLDTGDISIAGAYVGDGSTVNVQNDTITKLISDANTTYSMTSSTDKGADDPAGLVTKYTIKGYNGADASGDPMVIQDTDTNTVTTVGVETTSTDTSKPLSSALSIRNVAAEGSTDLDYKLSLDINQLKTELELAGISATDTNTTYSVQEADGTAGTNEVKTYTLQSQEKDSTAEEKVVAVIKDTDTTYEMSQKHDDNKTTLTLTPSVGAAQTATIETDGTTATMTDGKISVNATTYAGDSGTASAKPGQILNVNGDGTNITTSATENGVKVKLSENISVKSVTSETVTVKEVLKVGDSTTINNDGVTVGKTTKITKDSVQVNSLVINNNGPEFTEDGIDMHGQTITHVADAVDNSDAINMSQLMAMESRVENRLDSLNKRIGAVDEDANAGVATAMAVAGLPQAYLPGKSMIAVAGATYRGEQGYAIGYSYNTESSKWTFKFSGTSDTQGHFGGMLSAGYHFD